MTTKDLGKVIPEKGVDYFTAEEIAQIKAEVTQELQEQITTNADNIETANTNIETLQDVTGTGTDTFSTSNTYAVGDVVVKDNKVYRCITAITTAGAWDSTKWEEINIRQEQDEQNTKIEQLETDKELLASNYDSKEVTIEGNGTITDAINWYSDSTIKGKTSQDTTSISGGDEYDSPSPEHPQPIHNVSGNVVTDVFSNLFDYKNYTYDKTIMSTYRFVEIKGLKPNTTYTIYNYDDLRNSSVGGVFLTLKPNYASVTSAGTIKSGTNYYPQKTRATDNNGTMYIGAYIQGSWTEALWNEFISYFKNAMFVEGTDTSSSYVEYGREIVTFPLSEGQKMYEGDYLADDGIHHKYKSKIWNTAYLITGIRKASDTRFILDVTNHKTWGNVYSNYFNNDKTQQMYISGSNNSGQLWLYDKDSVFEGDVQNVKDFFTAKNNDETPVETVFECAEEVIEPYTEAQQLAWNKIKKMRTYKNITHITTSSDDLAPGVKIKYLQNPLIGIQNDITSMQAQILELAGGE